MVFRVARENGLDPSKFCKIRNTCFDRPAALVATGPSSTSSSSNAISRSSSSSSSSSSSRKEGPFQQGLQAMAQLSTMVSQEFSDWFEDPMKTSDWLVGQQERMVFEGPDLVPNAFSDLLAQKSVR